MKAKRADSSTLQKAVPASWPVSVPSSSTVNTFVFVDHHLTSGLWIVSPEAVSTMTDKLALSQSISEAMRTIRLSKSMPMRK